MTGVKAATAWAAVLLAAAACGDTGRDALAPATGEAPAVARTSPGPDDAGKPLFVDVTEAAGIRFLHHEDMAEMQPVGGGVVVFDYNGDGLDDAYLTDSLGPNALFRNNGDGTFTDVARAAGVDDPVGHSNGGCAADYDNDGDQDLYLTNHGSSRLFRNDGVGAFSDVTTESGVVDADPSFKSTGCAWGDYDRDGHLDLVVTRHFRELTARTLVEGAFHEEVRSLALYRNTGGGAFTDETELLGHTGHPPRSRYGEPLGNLWGAGFQPGWLDYDNDGDSDLYVANDWGTFTNPNVLWRNDGPLDGGGWSFVDVSEESGAGAAMEAMSVSVGDYNLDGRLDVFVTNVGASLLLEGRGKDGSASRPYGSGVYGNGGGTFVDAAASAGAEMAMIGVEKRVTWGSAFLDYDNDGWEDLYVASGFLKPTINPQGAPSYMKRQHNRLLRNRGDGTFEDVSDGSGADDPGVGRGMAYLDMDGDGCLDLLVGNLGGSARLFRNACGTGNNWLAVSLVGTRGNRDGIGARITLETGGRTQTREVSSGGSFMSQHMLTAHFGLGWVTSADRLTVRWPSGATQTLVDVRAGQRITVVEPGE